MKKKKGYVFWITGLPGSGKTSVAKKLKHQIDKKIGKCILINGDEIRDIFKLKRYDKKSRLKYALSYAKLSKLISSSGVNVIIATVALFHKVQKWNKNNIPNYVEIYIQANIKKIIQMKKKRLYFRKDKNIVGKDIVAEFPKNPDIKINNNFEISNINMTNDLFKKIQKVVH